ncbi:hypothetical protein [Aureispira anguillae]|uniref:BON domain-containing protein n=1 Tax=Aureispira anguillae TaxID=2864201 RepID=A0A915YMT4_9BACT|nr:hypothetical protein [Aureispira anguillae]BDS15693.1 hypothetical protein AsAng_0064770 [Aureispira anguillae]
MKTLKKIIVLSFFLLGLQVAAFAQTACEFIGEISIDAVERGAFLACSKSGNPAACSIALAAHACGQDPACSGLVKHFTQKGCEYTVKVVGSKLKLYGKASKEKIEELKETYDVLNTVSGIKWLENRLLGL